MTAQYILAVINPRRTRTASKAIRRSRDTPSYSTAHRQSYLTQKKKRNSQIAFLFDILLRSAYHKPVSTPTSEHNTQYSFKSILRPGQYPTANRTGKHTTIGATEWYVLPDVHNSCDDMRGTDCDHERDVLCQQNVPHALRDVM
jgi:hypothetical protein